MCIRTQYGVVYTSFLVLKTLSNKIKDFPYSYCVKHCIQHTNMVSTSNLNAGPD